MNPDPNKPAPFKLRWVEWVVLICAVISAVFAVTGPVSASVLLGLPDKLSIVLQSVTAFLAKYGWYIASFFVGLVMAWQWERVVAIYGEILGILLSPVLQSSRSKICYGDFIVLKHFTTGHFLTSLKGQTFNHVGGSGQQITFGAANPDENSFWVIRAGYGVDRSKFEGKEVKVGDVVRFYHLASRIYLHSHSTPSPGSIGLPTGDQQREVTVSAHDNVQDNWIVSETEWYPFGTKWRFMHSDGAQYLHSHDRAFGVTGRSSTFEITCCSHKNEDDYWQLLLVRDLRKF